MCLNSTAVEWRDTCSFFSLEIATGVFALLRAIVAHGRTCGLNIRSGQLHSENPCVARLDLLALRLDRRRVALHALDRRERWASRPVLHLCMKGAMSEVDEDLLTLDAK